MSILELSMFTFVAILLLRILITLVGITRLLIIIARKADYVATEEIVAHDN